MLRVLLKTVFISLISLSAFAKPVIIFDAGSTGTRMYLYEVEGNEATQVINTKIKPGLSELGPNLYTHYVKLLLNAAEEYLDDELKAQTSIYFYATGGVRILPQSEQDKIFNGSEQGPGLRNIVQEQAQAFGYPNPPDDHIRTITGAEEGMFVWIADNYATGTLGHSQLNTENTVAALELGGASAEIAFLPKDSEHHMLPFQHQGNIYQVYTYGYDGLGDKAALARMSNTHGFKKSAFASCFPVGAPYPDADKPMLIGKGNFNACVNVIKAEMIDPKTYLACRAKHGSHCSDLGIYQPSTKAVDLYILTSGFYYVLDYLGLANEEVDIADFVEASQSYCSAYWEDIEANDPDNPYALNICFNAALAKSLLDIWHVRKSAHLMAVNVVDDQTLEWPLGAALSLGR